MQSHNNGGSVCYVPMIFSAESLNSLLEPRGDKDGINEEGALQSLTSGPISSRPAKKTSARSRPRWEGLKISGTRDAWLVRRPLTSGAAYVRRLVTTAIFYDVIFSN